MAAKAKKPQEPVVTDVVWRKIKGQWYRVSLNGKKVVLKEKVDEPFSD